MQWIQIPCLGQISSLVADLYIDMSIFCFIFPRGNHFHDMGRFSNLLVVCLFLTFSQVCFFANVRSQAEAWRYNSTFDWAGHGAIAAWLRWLYRSSPTSHKAILQGQDSLFFRNMSYLGTMKLFLQMPQYPLMYRFHSIKCQDTRTCIFFFDFLILKAFVKVKLPWGTVGTISNILTINNLGLTRMMVCFSLEVSRTESKRLEEANILPNSTVTAIIAAVPWLQMLKQHLTLLRHALDRRLSYIYNI